MTSNYKLWSNKTLPLSHINWDAHTHVSTHARTHLDNRHVLAANRIAVPHTSATWVCRLGSETTLGRQVSDRTIWTPQYVQRVMRCGLNVLLCEKSHNLLRSVVSQLTIYIEQLFYMTNIVSQSLSAGLSCLCSPLNRPPKYAAEAVAITDVGLWQMRLKNS
jgi:hypothetical protein